MFLTTRQASPYLIPYSAHSSQSDSSTAPVGSCLGSVQNSVITSHLRQPSSRCPHSGLLSSTQRFSPLPHFLLLSLGVQGPHDRSSNISVTFCLQGFSVTVPFALENSHSENCMGHPLISSYLSQPLRNTFPVCLN